MAEFCKECFMKKLITPQERNDYKIGKYKIIESNDNDICESCNQLKPYVIEAHY